jgi:hypothetical protein
VRVLETGSLRAIREALQEQRFHVLHISCHAGPGVLILEDEKGEQDRVDAARFCGEALAVRSAGSMKVGTSTRPIAMEEEYLHQVSPPDDSDM